MCHLKLAERSGRIARDQVLALCDEGEKLAIQMEDQPRQAFFHEVKKRLA